MRKGGELEAYPGSMGTGIAKVFGLTAAAVGLNEKTLVSQGKKEGEDFYIVQIRQRSHASYYPGAKEIDIRVIFNREGKILGAQIIGADGVDKRIDVIATVMALGGNIESLKKLELSYAPPYSSAKDPVNMVGFVAGNILSGMVKIRRPLEAKKLHEEGQIVMLDVTEDFEREQWAMEGSLHIPHGQVRARLSELPKDKEICIYCAVGVRAYNVARILNQNGFEHVTVCAGGRGFYRLASYGK
ncbi:MAG: rhodanese-like domain-containing protein, partial [Bacillota bacterium]|nr:rhodanese-like domain-containing protein [Bacillota bacterium]